jgi:hypothetical protein
MQTFTHKWPWKIQETATVVILPALCAVPALMALPVFGGSEPAGAGEYTLAGVGVFFSALLWWTGYSRKARSRILATLDGDTLSLASLRHGESSGDLSEVDEVREYLHKVTGEAMVIVRTKAGALCIPVRLLDGNPALAAIVAARTGYGLKAPAAATR